MPKRWVFPVPGGQYTNDYGGARSPGATGGTGKHQGNDIFAPRGTPVVAVEDGTITKIGPSKIGGNRIWLNGKFYYAHLDSFAKGMKNGSVVRAGDIIGYVGDTGDAKGTPTHLHFGYDPSGGQGASYTNPYDYLQAAQKLAPMPTNAETRASAAPPDPDGTVVSDEVKAQAEDAPRAGGVAASNEQAAGGAAAAVLPGKPASVEAIAPQKQAPQVQTWQALSLLPFASPDTQRFWQAAQDGFVNAS